MVSFLLLATRKSSLCAFHQLHTSQQFSNWCMWLLLFLLSLSKSAEDARVVFVQVLCIWRRQTEEMSLALPAVKRGLQWPFIPLGGYLQLWAGAIDLCRWFFFFPPLDETTTLSLIQEQSFVLGWINNWCRSPVWTCSHRGLHVVCRCCLVLFAAHQHPCLPALDLLQVQTLGHGGGIVVWLQIVKHKQVSCPLQMSDTWVHIACKGLAHDLVNGRENKNNFYMIPRYLLVEITPWVSFSASEMVIKRVCFCASLEDPHWAELWSAQSCCSVVCWLTKQCQLLLLNALPAWWVVISARSVLAQWLPVDYLRLKNFGFDA